jgi:replicative DNA helicase
MAKKQTDTEQISISERKLPHDINAEAAVLSAMIIDSDVISKGIEKLQESYFFRMSHRLIFRNICELFNDGIEVDILTLINRLERNNQLEKTGGKAYLSEIADIVVSSANFDYHLNIVIEQALLRHLIVACNGIIESCYSSTAPVKTVVDEAEQAIFSIAEMPASSGVYQNRSDIRRGAAQYRSDRIHQNPSDGHRERIWRSRPLDWRFSPRPIHYHRSPSGDG